MATFEKVSAGHLVPSAVGGQESEAVREERLRTQFRSPEFQVLYYLGFFLQTLLAKGKSIAHWIIELSNEHSPSYDPKGVELRVIEIAGIDMPVLTRLSLNNLYEWGCPACRSANGSAVGASKKKDSRPNPLRMANLNHVIYAPVSHTLFVVSENCWKRWFVGLGYHKRLLNAATYEGKQAIRKHWASLEATRKSQAELAQAQEAIETAIGTAIELPETYDDSVELTPEQASALLDAMVGETPTE